MRLRNFLTTVVVLCTIHSVSLAEFNYSRNDECLSRESVNVESEFNPNCTIANYGGIFNMSNQPLLVVEPNTQYKVLISEALTNYFCLLNGPGYSLVSTGCFDAGCHFVTIQTNSNIGSGITLVTFGGCDVEGNFSFGKYANYFIPVDDGSTCVIC